MKLKPGSQLLGDRGAADEVAALEDERLEAGLGQVGAVDQAVVAAADDDGVVASLLVLRHAMSGRLSRGVEERAAGSRRRATVSYWWLIVSSRLTLRPGLGEVGTAPGPSRCAAAASASTSGWWRSRPARPSSSYSIDSSSSGVSSLGGIRPASL